MGCNCYKKKMLKRMDRLIQEVRLFRKLAFPISQPLVNTLGTTKTLNELETDMGIFMQYEQLDMGDLPEAVGPNADITKGVLIVTADGVESMRTDVNYDLSTRKVSGPVAWQAPKGSDVVLGLEYLDDETPPNASPITSVAFGLAVDNISPDAPTDAALGRTQVTGEVDIP